MKAFIGIWLMGWLYLAALTQDEDETDKESFEKFLFCGVITFVSCSITYWLLS